jgi:TetR/AcrR family transcriptional repressor of mexJK operon
MFKARSASKGDRTRRQIVDAAYRLMIRQGYAATSMRQIAARAHLALGGIYNHFSSKADVFAAIVEERHPFLEILPILNAVEGDSVESFVRNAAHTLVDELGHHPDFLNLMLIEIVEFKATHVPRLFGMFPPLILPVTQRIGQLDGNIRQMPPLDLARAFLGMFFSYYITEILVGQAVPSGRPSETLDHFVDIFLYGILVQEAV